MSLTPVSIHLCPNALGHVSLPQLLLQHCPHNTWLVSRGHVACHDLMRSYQLRSRDPATPRYMQLPCYATQRASSRSGTLIAVPAIGMAASGESKEGYEAVPVVDAAMQAAQFMISGDQPVKTQQAAAAPVVVRSWEGPLFCCFGRCDSVGLNACSLSCLAPCFAFGCVTRRSPSLRQVVSVELLLPSAHPVCLSYALMHQST